AQVSSVAEAQRAVAGGVNAVVVTDAGLARSLRDAPDASGGRTSRVTVVGCVADASTAGEMIGAGADALLVSAAELPRVLAMPVFGAMTAPARSAVRTGHLPRPSSRHTGGPSRNSTIGGALERASRSFGSREALVQAASGRRLTYAALELEAKRVARALL